MDAKITKIFYFGNDVDIFLRVSGDMSMIRLAVYCFLGERIENPLRVWKTGVSLQQKTEINDRLACSNDEKILLTFKNITI